MPRAVLGSHMTWPVAVAGTVHIDTITTPHGTRRGQQGGSAVYFSLAASRYAPVHLNAIVGSDTQSLLRATLGDLPVGLDGLVVSPRPSFRWTAVHDFERWVTGSESEEPGCDPEWDATLSEPARSAPVFFVGSMRPELQVRALEQSRARLIGADSMTVFIGDGLEAVQRVAEGADVLFLNRSELAALTGRPAREWESAARALLGPGRLRAVVVKAGPLGAAVVTASATVARPAVQVGTVIDPTGAGDALAGGFLGACAQQERDDDSFFTGPALDEGLRRAAQAIAAFGTEALVRGAPD